MGHPVHFVGAGPGDPELITVRGKRLLDEADRIVFAGSLVPPVLFESRKHGSEVFDSASMTLEQTHRLLVEGYRAGKKVVRLHTGDPSLYGAIQEQIQLLDREDIPFRVVPGVSAVFAAAAALNQELTLPEVSQTLILTRMGGRTPVPESENLKSLASHRATLAIYLSIHQIESVVSDLGESYPPDTPVVVAHRVGWPDERFVSGTLSTIAGIVASSGIHRQALILVGRVFDARHGEIRKSRLYDRSFEHGFRKADPQP